MFAPSKMSKKDRFGVLQTHIELIKSIHMDLTGEEPSDDWLTTQVNEHDKALVNNEGKYCDYKNNTFSDTKKTKSKSTKSGGGQTQGRYCFRDAMREKNPKVSLQEMEDQWKSMTEEERQPYMDMAKEHNMRLKNSKSSDDDSSDGEPVKKTKVKKEKKTKKKDDNDDDQDDDADLTSIPPPHPNGAYAKKLEAEKKSAKGDDDDSSSSGDSDTSDNED